MCLIIKCLNFFFVDTSPDELINNNTLEEIKRPSSIKDYTSDEAYNLNKLKILSIVGR